MSRNKTQLPPELEINGADYEVPETEYTHAHIVGNATQQEVDACILVPTLRPDYLEYHALTALFTSPPNTSVMVMSSNAGVRRRYKDLGLRGPHLIYSETHWTLASVKAEGDLAQKTELYTNQDGYPQFLYAKYSTRLPKGKDADRVHTVIYDSTVTFDWDRWTEFNEWREEHEIASVVYFCRDPTSPVADQVLDEVDTTWGWTPSALADMYDQGQGGVDTSAASDGAGIVPETTLRDQELLQQRAEGVTFDLQILPSGDVAEALSTAWNRHDSLKESAYKIGDDDAITAVKGVERAINGYSRLIADPEYSRNYRVGHGREVQDREIVPASIVRLKDGGSERPGIFTTVVELLVEDSVVHADHVRVNDRPRLVIGEAQGGVRRIPTDVWKLQEVLEILGYAGVPKFLADLDQGVTPLILESERIDDVPKTVLVRFREVFEGRIGCEEFGVDGFYLLGGCFLEKDLCDQDFVRVGRVPPRERPQVVFRPVKQVCAEVFDRLPVLHYWFVGGWGK